MGAGTLRGNMGSLSTAYGFLALAIISEVIGTTSLAKTEQFTRPLPTVVMAVCFMAAFYFLSQSLKTIPLGVAYAIWSGLGTTLTAIIGVLVFHQKLSLPGVVGIAMIVGGVVLLNAVSTA